MTSTTPASEPRPQGRAEEHRGDEHDPAEVPMRTLLAACRAAAAVSTPPERLHEHEAEPRRAA